jgi:hypothetical protein
VEAAAVALRADATRGRGSDSLPVSSPRRLPWEPRPGVEARCGETGTSQADPAPTAARLTAGTSPGRFLSRAAPPAARGARPVGGKRIPLAREGAPPLKAGAELRNLAATPPPRPPGCPEPGTVRGEGAPMRRRRLLGSGHHADHPQPAGGIQARQGRRLPVPEGATDSAAEVPAARARWGARAGPPFPAPAAPSSQPPAGLRRLCPPTDAVPPGRRRSHAPISGASRACRSSAAEGRCRASCLRRAGPTGCRGVRNRGGLTSCR